MTKKSVLAAAMALILFVTFIPPVTAEDKIGEITAVKRFVQGDDKIEILAIDDPDNPFVTCYLTTVKTGQFLALADPSNNSIACRLTRPVPVRDGKQVFNKSTNDDIFSLSKSVLSKELRISRHYDPKRNVLVYVSYVTKEVGGSVKHSLSVVPLGIEFK